MSAFEKLRIWNSWREKSISLTMFFWKSYWKKIIVYRKWASLSMRFASSSPWSTFRSSATRQCCSDDVHGKLRELSDSCEALTRYSGLMDFCCSTCSSHVRFLLWLCTRNVSDRSIVNPLSISLSTWWFMMWVESDDIFLSMCFPRERVS